MAFIQMNLLSKSLMHGPGQCDSPGGQNDVPGYAGAGE